MIVNDKDAATRLNSPMNLINKLRNVTNSSRTSAMSLFCGSKDNKEKIREEVKITFNPFENKPQPSSSQVIPPETIQPQPPVLNDILENHESQIKLGLAHDNALTLLNSSVALLSAKLDDVKADKLPAVIAAASKTVESIRRERNEASKNTKDREVHYHFYTPQQKKVSDFEIIDVGSSG